jgi:4-amino-4-deoxy-L-arabinose transferase-like glycosyltransferase
MKYFIVSFILLSLILQCILSIKDKVVTYDEPAHLPAGYSYLFIRDFRMNPEHPPLIKMIAALPLLFLNLKHPKQMRSWQGKDAYAFGVEFLYHSGQDADKIIFWGRIPIIFLSLLLGLSVFFWAERLFGFKAGIFALFLYSFSPIILAHSRLVTYDIGVSLFITLAFYSLWKYLNQPSNSRVILSGMSLGLALLSKFNAIILIPSFIALIYIYRPKRRFSHFVIILFLIFLIAFFTLWVGYGFETGKVLEDQKTHNTFNLLMKNYPKPLQNVVYFLGRYLTLPMPSYFKGLGWTAYCNLQKHESFLCGRHFRGSSFFDFLIAFLIKTPIPFLTFLLFSILVVIKNKIFFKRDQIFLLVLPGIIFIATSISAYSLHLKYVLPIYPLFCIFISQIVNYNFLRLKTIRFLFLGMCVWYFLGTLNIYPHYLMAISA